MMTVNKPLFNLTAGDLMSRDLVLLNRNLPLREAVRWLRNTSVHGAPVVDGDGKCVGVLSVTDFLRPRREATPPTDPLPRSCSYQQKVRSADGQELTTCTLPLGVCPVQRVYPEPDGRQDVVCVLPYCIFEDWQVVETDDRPVHQFMTADPVTVTADRSIADLARMMIDARIHRVIVVDDQDRPVGIVSSTDLVAALARVSHDVESFLG
jgi:CBS domain-containing protein